MSFSVVGLIVVFILAMLRGIFHSEHSQRVESLLLAIIMTLFLILAAGPSSINITVEQTTSESEVAP